MRDGLKHWAKEVFTHVQGHFAWWLLGLLGVFLLSGAPIAFKYVGGALERHLVGSLCAIIAALLLASAAIIAWLQRRLITMKRSYGNQVIKTSELSNNLAKVEAQIKDLKERRPDDPFIRVNGQPLVRITEYLIERMKRRSNLARLNLFSVSLELTGPDRTKNVNAVYKIIGENSSQEPMKEYYLTIGADSPATLLQLDPTGYELHSDPNRERKLTIGPLARWDISGQGGDRSLTVHLREEVERGKPFHLEISYSWPSTFQLPKDYWFIDGTDAKTPAARVVLDLRFDPSLNLIGQVQAFHIHDHRELGGTGATSFSPGRIYYDNPHADDHAIYVMMIQEAGNLPAPATP